MPQSSAAARPSAELSNIPAARLPYFMGRELILGELWTSLNAGLRTQVIHGLGGVGKTEVAAEYARRYRADYAIAWWVRADSESALLASFAQLATRLGRTVSENASAEVVRDLLKSTLALRSDWLLIFDAVPSADSVRSYLPGSPGGHTIITTRSIEVTELGEPMPLDVLTRDESIRFFRHRIRTTDPASDLDRLAQALGDLPLALEQAGAVISGTGISFAEYLNRLETEWAELLQAGTPSTQYPNTLGMTWGVAFAAVETDSQPAAALLNFVSFLCPDSVTNKMLRDGNAFLPNDLSLLARHPVSLEKAMAKLGEYSLAQSDGTGVVVHRLVAHVTRDRLGIDEQRSWCSAAIFFLSQVFKFDSADVRSWKKCGELLPHVLEAAAHADRLNVAPESTAELLNDAGRYLLKRAQYIDARRALNRAMAINSRRFSDTDPRLSAVANNLGRVYEQMGDDAVAVRYFELALTLDQTAYGAGHPHVAEVINNYGICIQKQGDHQQARDKFAYAASVYENHYGPDHPKLANILNNLGYAMLSIGEQDEAESQLLRALTIAEATVGPEHPTTASILYNLATSLTRRGEPAAARSYLERAMQIDETVLGLDHPNTRRDIAALEKLGGTPALA